MTYKDFISSTENELTIPNEWLFERFRLWRDAQLKASDWTQLSDAVCDKSAWATYRQELRDLPASNADPRKIIFPSKPA